MDEDDERTEVDGQLTIESIKLISESMGISNLNEEAINLLIDDGTYRLKQLAQVRLASCFFACLLNYPFWKNVRRLANRDRS